MEPTTTVRDQILEHAITLMMLRGYNGFSYRDLSELVGVKTSSIHYYFPSKDDLVLEAVSQYSNEILGALGSIESSLPADQKLGKYTKLQFQAKNLTNAKIETVYRSQFTGPDQTRSSYSLGLEYSLALIMEFRF